jgi:hypothetical protein
VLPDACNAVFTDVEPGNHTLRVLARTDSAVATRSRQLLRPVDRGLKARDTNTPCLAAPTCAPDGRAHARDQPHRAVGLGCVHRIQVVLV